MNDETDAADQADTALNQALKTASDFKQALDEHAIVAITDPKGKISYVNEKFCEISGYGESELMGQDHRIISSGHHGAEFFKDLWATIGSGLVWRGEIRNRRKDGSIYWVDTTIVPFLDERKKPLQYIAIRADITERKLQEESLKKLANELKRKNREMQSMVYAVSHDLRSPLVNVQGFATMLGENVEGLRKIMRETCGGTASERGAIDVLGKEMDLELGFIKAATVKMDDLLNGLLAVSRLENANFTVRDLDVNEAVRSNLAAMEFQILKAGAEVKLTELPMAKGDEALLDRVFSNLFSNALKYASPGRGLVLEISGESIGGKSVIRVADNGIGIGGNFNERIFDLFYRIDTKVTEGRGVGLAIVRGALDRMNGSISVTSEVGVGSVFTITLPGTCH